MVNWQLRVTKAYRWLRAKGRSMPELKQTASSAAPERQSSLLQDRSAHLHGIRKGLEKGAPKTACSPRQAGIPLMRSKNKGKYSVTPLTIGTWNVRALLDNPSANRPEPRTALSSTGTTFKSELYPRQTKGNYQKRKLAMLSFGVVEVATNVVMQVLVLPSNQI